MAVLRYFSGRHGNYKGRKVNSEHYSTVASSSIEYTSVRYIDDHTRLSGYSRVQSLCLNLLWDKCFPTWVQHLAHVILRQNVDLASVLFVCVPWRKMLNRNDLHLLSVGVFWFKLDRSHDSTRLCFTSGTFLSGCMERDEVVIGKRRLEKCTRVADMNNDDRVFMMGGGKEGPLLGVFCVWCILVLW